MAGNPRPEGGFRPEYPPSVAASQPSSVPILENPPTASELPTDENNEPVGVIYLDHSSGSVKVTVPDGTGGVATGTLADLSASLSLDTGDLTGFL